MEIGFELPQSYFPCLLHGIYGEDEEIFHSIFEGHPFSAEISYLSDKSLISSHNGWWVVKDLEDDECIFILNPRSMENIELPKLESPYQSFDRCILTDSPKSLDCRFVLFDYDSTDILFCKIGDSKFTKQVLESELSSVAMVGGRIYGLPRFNNKLVSLSFDRQTLEIMEVIRIELIALSAPPEFFRIQKYLIESNDELLFVIKIYSPSYNDEDPPYNMEVADFKIHKMDSCSSSWKELRTIGDHRTLFLDATKGISCNVDGGRSKIIEGNCIYYVDSYSHHLQKFDLKDGGISDVPYSPPLSDANCSKHRFQWISLPY